MAKKGTPGPYTRLRTAFKKYVNAVTLPRTRRMWRYPKAKLDEAWTLGDLYERVAAARQIGYDVVLYAADDGLVVEYREQVPPAPLEIL